MDSDDEVVEEAVEGTTGFSPGSWGGDRRLGRKAPKEWRSATSAGPSRRPPRSLSGWRVARLRGGGGGAALPTPRRRERAGRGGAGAGNGAPRGPGPWEGWAPASRRATAASSLGVATLPSTLALVLAGMEEGRASPLRPRSPRSSRVSATSTSPLRPPALFLPESLRPEATRARSRRVSHRNAPGRTLGTWQSRRLLRRGVGGEG